MRARTLLAMLLFACICLASGSARAFTHVVQHGDTLAAIAERYYGRIQYEQLLVAANGLDAQGGSPIVPGMRLTVPSLSHYVARKGQTWDQLATLLLGTPSRSDVLAIANGTTPWMPLQDGAEIVVPFNLHLILAGGENIVTLAFKYLGDKNKAWVLDRYNNLKGRELRRGDVFLVPLTDLPLTDAGKKAAREAAGATCTEGRGETRAAQRRVDSELPALIADVRSGRYVDAVVRGNKFLAAGSLTTTQLASVHRQLLEAYVALEAPALATASCAEWRRYSPETRLDPRVLSPKIIAVCSRTAP
jgi:phage tail protein X